MYHRDTAQIRSIIKHLPYLTCVRLRNSTSANAIKHHVKSQAFDCAKFNLRIIYGINFNGLRNSPVMAYKIADTARDLVEFPL